MKPLYFHIINYKGIEDVFLDFRNTPSSHVLTLVGLNESGKTTVLEALNHIVYKPESFEVKAMPGRAAQAAQELIPMHLRGDFTGSIKVILGLEMTQDEIKALQSDLKEKIGFSWKNPNPYITITDEIQFQNSERINSGPRTMVGCVFKGSYGGGKGFADHKAEHWKVISDLLFERIPSILYFPNFLFDFPDTINLQAESFNPEEFFFRRVFEDIVTSYNPTLDLRKNVINRFLSKDPTDKQTLDNLLYSISQSLSNQINESWNEITDRFHPSRRILISLRKVKDKVYASFQIDESGRIYRLSDRSVGFRWFFSFFVLTQFRGSRRESLSVPIFLFDEPAANLHAAAQQKLLTQFQKLGQSGYVIYSTHSHHLINPNWLEGAYVVKNGAVVYDDVTGESEDHVTNIELTRYREFVSDQPDQTLYFKPILDVLEYTPSRLEFIPEVILVEGKNDYYILTYFLRHIVPSCAKLDFLPGGGAGTLDSIIRLYLAWGRNFIVLLDSDKEGKAQKERYAALFEFLLDNRVFDLSSETQSLGLKEVEDLISSADKEALRLAYAPNLKSLNKKVLTRIIQELLAQGAPFKFSGETCSNFEKLYTSLAAGLDQASNLPI